MKKRIVPLTLLILVLKTFVFSQAENVTAGHHVYDFLKRMHVKHIIERYFDAIIPMSRSTVQSFLDTVETKSDLLSSAELGYLDEFQREFAYDRDLSTSHISSVFTPGSSNNGLSPYDLFSEKEKFLYFLKDKNVSLFVNGLAAADARRFFGEAGNRRSEFFQGGVRMRGTLFNNLGIYGQVTNAQFWGSRELLQSDPIIGQSYALGTTNSKNFDFSEGYARYETQLMSVQAGRERLFWGYGQSQQMVLSDNIRVFDFLKADFSYKSFKYTFLHGWILGQKQILPFSLASDSLAVFDETVVADKYIAAHRIEFSFGHILDVGFQEMAIYSNRSVDLAYLNPFILIESAQRSREERDNILWMFDVRTRALRGVEIHASFLLDDLHFTEIFSDSWVNRFGFQFGGAIVDPMGLNNITVACEYTRIEPYVFSHGRSRENDYGSLGRALGPSIGPNADLWMARLDYFPWRKLYVSLVASIGRSGENTVDAGGSLIKNVGGDILQPHRNSDPETKVFLDGILVKTQRYNVQASFEMWNQIWCDLRYEYQLQSTDGVKATDQLLIGRLRAEF